jgi:hypothetical protein
MAAASWENAFVRSIFGRHLGLAGDREAANQQYALITEDNKVLGTSRTIIAKAAAGSNGAGAIVIAGTQIGDVVVSVTTLSTPGDASSSFESTVSVAGQVQQISVSNLSGNTYLFVVQPQS